MESCLVVTRGLYRERYFNPLVPKRGFTEILSRKTVTKSTILSVNQLTYFHPSKSLIHIYGNGPSGASDPYMWVRRSPETTIKFSRTTRVRQPVPYVWSTADVVYGKESQERTSPFQKVFDFCPSALFLKIQHF